VANANGEVLQHNSAKIVNSQIIQPCFIGAGVELNNSTVGPYVSIGNNTTITNSVISNSIIQENAALTNANLTNSMIGNFVLYNGQSNELSLSDYSTQIKS
jgi:glucose-1-phosphate thymidylyltransferase